MGFNDERDKTRLGKLSSMLALLAAAQHPSIVSAKAAYSEPDPDGISIEGSRSATEWKDASQALVWYGEAKEKGRIGLALPTGSPLPQRMTMTVGKTSHVGVQKESELDFGVFSVPKGPIRMALTTDRAPGPSVSALSFDTDDAFRMSESTRRNAASVHLRWPTPKGEDIRWFTNEAAMLTDAEWSYTMACGFARGYFGMQVNSPTERRIIFSVWDAGNEAVDRSKVGAESRVELVAKGEGVFADSFGNEGTGGHSHLVFPWKTGEPIRFLVGCRHEGDKTLYAGYFKAQGDRDWRLVAAFRAPKDGGPLRDLYSFSEDFVGANGQRWRESTFAKGWVGLADGSWQPLTKAVFTTDGHGKTERWDYDASVRGGRFHLRHGGFLSGTAKYGDTLNLAKIGGHPDLSLPTLPN